MNMRMLIGSNLKLIDHFILKHDDDVAVEAIKKVMRAAYTRHRYKIHLEYVSLVKKLGSHEAAMAHPRSYCSNKHDWTHMCGYFRSPEFEKLSERGRKSAAAKTINHSSGNKSHTSVKYDLVRKGKPCDPCTVFIKTHNSGKMNDQCKAMKKKMEDLKKASDKGEINDTSEEIYYKCRNADGEYLGKRRRKAPQTHYSLYRQKEKETSQLKERLTLVEKENKLLKKQKVTKESLNAYFLKNGLSLMEFIT
ncbi:hypothetical protein MKW94_013955 [Papaver nudicaule]|uniref:Uncharacterized protein n=1 Tax=Papaver nudicaule TaxID=74823 RepID=A0AA41V0T0_PAPNU|nr:hypothetical protein [Papaver nudicaule]